MKNIISEINYYSKVIEFFNCSIYIILILFLFSFICNKHCYRFKFYDKFFNMKEKTSFIDNSIHNDSFCVGFDFKSSIKI